MKLWSAQVAPNPRRVVIYLMEKGIDVETVDIDLGAKENFTPFNYFFWINNIKISN